MNDWTLNIEGGSKTIESPSWEQIQEVIQSLDGQSVTQADLSYNGNQLVLTIAGGVHIHQKKRYAVQFLIEKENIELFGIFINPEGNPSIYHTIPVEGIGTDFAENQLIDYEDAESIFRYVFENKELPPGWEWE